MYNLSIKNSKGDILNLMPSDIYTVTAFTGLDPVNATVATSSNVNCDGEVFTSVYVGKRNITIDMVLEHDVEVSRLDLYKYFQPKSIVKLMYKNGNRDIWVNTVVEDITPVMDANPQSIQIVLLAERPYLNSTYKSVDNANSVTDNLEFPLSIEDDAPIEFGIFEYPVNISVMNNGEVREGMDIYLTASGTVVNPIIYNIETKEFIGFDFTMLYGDEIYINTRTGEKKVILIRDAKRSNLINSIKKNITWLQNGVGENVYTYDCDSGIDLLTVRFEHNDLFIGV